MQSFSKSLLFILLSLITSNLLWSQSTDQMLAKSFSKYEIVHINSSSLLSNIKSQRSDEKNISFNNWDMTLFDSKIISPNYKLRISTVKGIVEQKNKLAIPMNGYTRQGGKASLTFNDNYIYGFVEINGTTMYIEPLYHFVKNVAADQYVVYDQKDIIDTEKHECGTTEQHRVAHDEHHTLKSERLVGNCYEVEYAIASDWLMFQKYGSVTGVENHAIGVTNNIQTNYDTEFADELKFIIVEQFVSNCSTCDPWTTSTNPNTLLNSFTNWGPGGFSTGHDVGSLWSDRDFDGSTIGIAWLGAVCTNIGYNALQDFSTNANLKRVMVAHEMGHNFDASHDASGSPYIMAPAVQNTTQWSSASITDIQNYYLSASCLSQCANSNAPIAQFTYNITQPCEPGKVQFTNQSTGTVTAWNWVFEGGTPATSTQQNPLVTYNAAGIYNVSLTVSNGSLNSTLTLNDEIEIITGPTADFDFNVNGNVVEFFNTSTTSGNTSYNWAFGDNSTSTDENPVHTYTDDGTYSVVLNVANDCGSSSVQFNVIIATLPTANFVANQTVGCATFTANFTSTSSNNTLGYSWVFLGGTPATSTLANPVVIYPTPGSYPVSLTVSNAQGTGNKTVSNYIVVNTPPSSSFTYTQSGLTFSFTSTSANATSLLWDFGDGNTSTLPNPIHTYSTAGNYTVFLTADNALCPENISSQGVNATSAPISSFSASANSGCASFTTTFNSTSTNNPTSFAWTFPGGNPSTSTLANPEVTYANAGSYDVTLVTTNSFGSNTLNLPNYINVTTVPVTDFSYQNTGLSYTFTSTSSNANSYVWDFGDGNMSTLENPTHTYGQQGTYTVKLITTNQCGQTEKTYSVSVLLAPVANAQSSTGEICANETVAYTDASSGTVVSRMWTFEGGSPATSSASEVNVSYTASGTYNVRLIVENSIGNDTFDFVKIVSLKPSPVSQFTWDINSNTINLSDASTEADSISWTGPLGVTYTTSTITYTPTSNGDYLFSLTAINECGTNTSTQLIAFYNIADANFTSNLEGLGNCAPVHVTYQAPKNNGATYEWTFEGGSPATSTEQNPTVGYNAAGVYDVQLIVTNAQGADTTSFDNYVSLGSAPKANYTEKIQGGFTSFEYTGEPAISYLWNFGGQGTSIEKNPNFTFTANGTYEIVCIATNSCGSDTISKTFTIIAVGTEDEAFKQLFSVYPNPVNDYLNVVAPAQYNMTIIDNTGKTVMHMILNEGNQKIGLQNMANGLYSLIITAKDKTAIFRFHKI